MAARSAARRPVFSVSMGLATQMNLLDDARLAFYGVK
jgi:hypothetical protein